MAEEDVTYEFGGFRLYPADRQLFDGDRPIPLTPKAFDTLVLLVERGGSLIEKDEFLARIWPDTIVEEVGLAHNISQLRRVLDKGTDSASFIQTVPKKGYRFAAPITVQAVARQTNERPSGIVLGVLPFDNLTGDGDREYLADSLTEEVIAALGQIDPDRFVVIGRTSMMTYKRTTKPIARSVVS